MSEPLFDAVLMKRDGTFYVRPRPNYESPSWERLTPASRRMVASAAGFNNVHQINRIEKSDWAALFEHERKALYRVNWKNVIARQERKR